jgi:hypothetical protein
MIGGCLRLIRAPNGTAAAWLDHSKLNRHRALDLWWSMIFSENRYPPIGSKPEGMLFRIML